jgi:hypothetical protein
MKIEVGQVWRKRGPFHWLKIENIQDPEYPGYDGGLIGCSARFYPPQLKGIKLRGGRRMFIPGRDWRNSVTESRFLLEDGQPANMM